MVCSVYFYFVFVFVYDGAICLLVNFTNHIRFSYQIDEAKYKMLISFDYFSWFCYPDNFCWTAKVQCQFPACISAYQGFNLHHIHLYPCYFDCSPPHDTKRYCSLHTRLLAYWLGFTSGQFYLSILRTLFCSVSFKCASVAMAKLVS